MLLRKSFVKSLLLLLLISTSKQRIEAQNLNVDVKDEWFNTHPSLKVGQLMPDMQLGEIHNNYPGKNKISELRGKLIILDFWTTSCGTCIAFFPKMEELQKKFENKIQIYIVNQFETQAQIEKAFEKRNAGKFLKKAKLPNLPSIVAAKEFSKYFPARFVPHHVWIDSGGLIQLIGHSFNTYEGKINALLAGEKIKYMKGENTTPVFNSTIPYHIIMEKSISPLKYNSFITPYHPNYAAISGGKAEQEIDSAQKTIRNTWVNKNIGDVCLGAFPEVKKRNDEIVVYSPLPNNTIFSVKDTAQFTDDFISTSINNYQLYDTNYIKSKICYEQIAPLNFSSNQLAELMRQDLNNYLEIKYGANVSSEKKIITCWVLKRTLSFDSERNTKTNKITSNKDNVGQMIPQNVPFKEFLRNYFHTEPFPSPLVASFNGKEIYFLDESGIDQDHAGFVMPEINEVRTMEDLRKSMQRYGLDIVKENRELEFIVISERK